MNNYKYMYCLVEKKTRLIYREFANFKEYIRFKNYAYERNLINLNNYELIYNNVKIVA